jgi:chemosensory pili system protein ChpC
VKDTAADEFYALLIPLADERLLLPRGCVAEVVAWTEPRPMTGSPPWYVGTVGWSRREIPVVSFEAVLGRALPQPAGRTRIVVLHGLAGMLSVGHFGILTQGFPQLVRVNKDVVKPDRDRRFGEHVPVLAATRLVNETPLVPDLEMLERMIAEETRVPSSGS